MMEAITRARKAGEMEKGKTPLGLAIDLFQLFNRSEGKSARTVEWYDLGVRQILAPAGHFSADVPIGSITELELRAFIAGLRERARFGKPLAPASLNNYVRAIRRFFKWHMKKG